MSQFGANIELAWLADLYRPFLIEAGRRANRTLEGESHDPRHVIWRRYPLLQGQFRRICAVDGLRAVFSRVDTAKFRTEGNLWLVVLHNSIYWHVKKFPLASIGDLKKPLEEPKTVQRARWNISSHYDGADVANRQLAFIELGFETLVIPVDPPLRLMRPIGLWYEIGAGQIAAWHLIEQSEHDIIASETIIVPSGPEATTGLPKSPPTPPINPKYNTSEDDSGTL